MTLALASYCDAGVLFSGSIPDIGDAEGCDDCEGVEGVDGSVDLGVCFALTMSQARRPMAWMKLSVIMAVRSWIPS